MGFISNAEKAQTGNQIKQWFDNANSLISSLEGVKYSLNTQLTAMRNNATDYTVADCNEVKALIEDINNKIKAL